MDKGGGVEGERRRRREEEEVERDENVKRKENLADVTTDRFSLSSLCLSLPPKLSPRT